MNADFFDDPVGISGRDGAKTLKNFVHFGKV